MAKAAGDRYSPHPRNRALHGSLDTLDDSLAAGFRKFGSKPFLMLRVPLVAGS